MWSFSIGLRRSLDAEREDEIQTKMKQVLIKKGQPLVADVPSPVAMEGFVLVALRASCVSPGTEMAGIANSGKSLLQRVIEQPDKAKAALSQMRQQGIGAVWKRAKQKFDGEGLCGYSAAGVVIDVGPGVEGITRGMRDRLMSG